MGLTEGEIRRLRVFVSPAEEMEAIIRKEVDEETWLFMKNLGSLDCFKDKLIVPRRKVPHQSIVLHKFITEDLDIPAMLKRIIYFMR